MSTALVGSGLVVVQAIAAPQASAAAQGGYVFNDAWSLTSPGSAATANTSADSSANATNGATTQIPTAYGNVGVTAAFATASGRTAGASYLTSGSNQGAYGASSSTFTGSPTVGNVPALGLVTQSSAGCGGALGTAAHQNFNGTCSVGTLTLTFSQPVTDPIMDISGLGGFAVERNGSTARGSFNSTSWTLATAGVQFANVSSGATNLSVTPTTLQVANRNASPYCNNTDRPSDWTAADVAMPAQTFAGCGSVTLQGTFTSVTFQVSNISTPWSVYPTSSHGTGTAFFRTSNGGDGINGMNITYGETSVINGSTSALQNADLQRISLRLPSTGTIGDFVWNDLNGNGVQDAGEPGVAGVQLSLLKGDGTPVTTTAGAAVTTTTGVNGAYQFTNLPFGDYRVQIGTLPTGFTLTDQDVTTTNDTLDSDFSPSTRQSGTVRITAAAPTNLTVDAGIASLGSIGDRVWRDDDADGIQDSGEPGIAGATVRLLTTTGTVVATTTTDANGAYRFDTLVYGSYVVEFVSPGASFRPTTQAAGSDRTVDSDASTTTGRSGTVTITITNPARTDVDAGFVPLGSIGDRVWLDTNRNGVQDAGEPGVAGATVTLLSQNGQQTIATTTTDANGAYLFSGLALGSYRIRVTDIPADASFTQQTAGNDVTLDSDVLATGNNAGRSGVIALTADNRDRRDIDAGVLSPLGSIGDRVWLDQDRDGIQDANEVGVAGVTVTLLDANGTAITSMVTGADGAYAFTNLAMGTYSVRFTTLPTLTSLTAQGVGSDRTVDSDANVTTATTAPITLAPGNRDRSDIDAGILAPLGSIGDRVWLDANRDGLQTAGEPGVAGVTVTLLDGDGNQVRTTTTDANGAYLFQGLELGTYSVQFATLPTGATYTTRAVGTDRTIDSDVYPSLGTTGQITLTVAAKDRTDVDAGILAPLGSIGDFVWLDANRNGVQDSGEVGVAGVTVTLLTTAGATLQTTTTDANGAYLFSNLPMGSYVVGFSNLPTGHAFTAMGAGTAATGSDASPTTGRTGTVTLQPTSSATRNRTDVDAGIVAPLGSIGDFVWLDQDRDGVQDAGEAGVAGVTVTLRNASGTAVATTTTDANGAYLFQNLELGTYSVAFSNLPTAATFTAQAQGGDANLDSDANATTGITGPVTLTVEAKDRRDVDAGVLPPLGSIGDRVWLDKDRDGIQDDGEAGLPGITVTLRDANGTAIATTTTGVDGAYSFTGLAMGTYSVAFSGLPTAATFTTQGVGSNRAVDSDADQTTGVTGPITLTPGAKDRTDVDAGVRSPLGSIGDRVWLDTDRDGIQDAGEPGVAGVTVTLRDANGTAIATTTTGADGAYVFSGLELGTYSVVFSGLPTATSLTTQGVGSDRALDSDANPTTGATAAITLTATAKDRSDVDAGVLPPLGSIGDFVWLDQDRDGIQDAGEPGVSGVTVRLVGANGMTVATTTTDANGAYLFSNLELGTYTVAFSTLPTATTLTLQGEGGDANLDSDANPATATTGAVTLTADAKDRRDVDAGVLPPLGSIGDRVWLDQDRDGIQDAGEPGVAGVTVTLRDASGAAIATTTTDANGWYVFSGLAMGDYSVAFSTLPTATSLTTQRAGSNRAIDSDANPATGATGTITLTPARKDRRDVDAGVLPPLGSIGDRVWLDTDRDGVQGQGEAGVAGVTVTLRDGDGATVATTTTDADGTYLFQGLELGTYSVAFSTLPTAATFTLAGQGGDTTLDSDADQATGITGAIVLTADAKDRRDVDAGVLPPLGSIGDRVWLDVDRDGVQGDGEVGVAGVTVTLRDANGQTIGTTTTDAEGAYVFTGLPMGDYSVVFSGLPTSATFAEQGAGDDVTVDSDADPTTGATGTITLTPATKDRTDVDAGVLPPLGSIGDFVWVDENRNGVQDEGEPGQPGITVTLLDGAGQTVATTTTGDDGSYVFPNLPMGDYTVVFSNLPTATTIATPGQGGDATRDSDANPFTGSTGTITLTPEVKDRTDVDAGILPPLGSIGDRVWLDVNRNGVQDEGELGLAGVTVTLLDANGQTVATTTTSETGSYGFVGLAMGDYSVVFSGLPTAATFAEQGAGDDVTVDSDANPTTGATGTITLTPAAKDRTDVDAGVQSPLGSIGDTVWLDANRNGVQDEDETGVAGITVTLRDATGAEVDSTETAADGTYLFDGLEMGDYTVVVSNLPTAATFTAQTQGDDRAVDSDVDVTTGATGTITLTPEAKDRTDVDAGILAPLGSIGDRVWLDTNRNGVQDEGELGQPDVTVTLLEASGAVVGTTTTDDAGAYVFTGLPMGDYSVVFSNLPTATTIATPGQGDDRALDSDANPFTGSTGTITLTPEAKDRTDVDAGILPPLGSIGDRVWLDVNRNGVQDEGEAGVADVTVTLLDANGETVATTTTSETGSYGFIGLELGDYSVVFSTLPASATFAEQGAGDDVTVDSDANPETGATGTITLTADAKDRTDVDAGILPPLGSIGDTVWLDANRNGVQDQGETGVAGVTVTLLDGTGATVATTTTGDDGSYVFPNLPMGDYTVVFSNLPTSATFAEQGAGDDVTVDSDANPETGATGTITLTPEAKDRTDVDAGVLPPLGSIGDRVWLDLDADGVQDDGEPGVAGVTVTLLDANGAALDTTTTDDDGAYAFTGLAMGTYAIEVSGLAADVRITTPAQGDAALDSDVDQATGRTGAIALTPEAKDRTDVDAGIVQLGSIGDTVWRDLDDDGIQDDGEPGVAGVTVTLLDANGQTVATTTTAADGTYLFDGLELGDYTVVVTSPAADLGFTTPGAGDDRAVDSDVAPATGAVAVTIDHEQPHRTDVDAGLVQLGSIGDRVWRDLDGDGIQDDGEPGVDGATVTLLDAAGDVVATTVTAGGGLYAFTGLAMGDYTVVFTGLPADTIPSPQGAGEDGDVDSDADETGTTGTVTLTNERPDVTDVDAGVTPVGSIGDRVWRDLDGDGIQDDGEPGVAGVTVTLLDASGAVLDSTTTDDDGAYLFEGLLLGDYSVTFTDVPAGLALTQQGAGDDRTVDSDADAATGATATVTIADGAQDRRDVDAGLVALGSIGDTVWYDADRDGIQDEGELGAAGITVVLYDAAGTEIARTETDAQGTYLFAGLAMGEYSVGFEDLGTNVSLTVAGAGDDRSVDSDANPATGRTGAVVLTNELPDVDDVDAGLVGPLGSIGSIVWYDPDFDGQREGDEDLVEGVTVILLDANGVEVARTVTDADGRYLFTGLPMGDYTVQFTDLPEGWWYTSHLVGDPETDSNADRRTGDAPVTLTQEVPDQLAIDAGLAILDTPATEPPTPSPSASEQPPTPSETPTTTPTAPAPTTTPTTPAGTPASGLPRTGAELGFAALLALLAGLLVAAGLVLGRRSRRQG
ncbi:SdrD B-like domain-containing protein [Agrococcus jejuensis]|uniref:SdrD B-like domain-containing protein n=1 Tax=Agrococcus jejuensis TaxID=399736 RepID=UPI00156054F2|nr:SdrD B-like domain-containing protein [Agrococcus jejuensis]